MQQAAVSEGVSDAIEVPFRLGKIGKRGLPLVIRPGDSRSIDDLSAWLRAHPDWVQEKLTQHGAILFRGFDVDGPQRFEQLARAIDNDLKNNYLGTSPRDALTEYVFSASELPGYYPIPQHCEMSFIANPPRRLFFTCLVEPGKDMGETPLVDFRMVWRDLDPQVRERFLRGGVRIVRNYGGPQDAAGKFNLWQLKRWDEMFGTTDKAEVERQCRAEGFEAQWTPGDGLRLVSTQPVFRDHPVSGERVWHNHTQVFHLSAAAGEYARIYNLRPTWKNWGLRHFAQGMVTVNRLLHSADEQALHCTYEDGSEIPDADMEAVRDAIWKHLVITPWKKGDVVAIDNHSVAHGRLPYEGPRQVAVCWA